MIKFSICIPNYNYADFLKITLLSVLEQTYPPYEIIVSDNASTDHSISIVKSFNNDKIKLIENKYNIGFAPNLDKVTEKATGDYLIVLSSDDLIEPEALAEYAKIIETNNGIENPLLIMSACKVINENGMVNGHKYAMTGDVKSYFKNNNIMSKLTNDTFIEHYEGHQVLKAVLSGSFQPAGQFLTTCFSKKLYDMVEGYHATLTMSPDAFFSHKVLFQNPDVFYLNKPLFSYRIHNMNNLASTQKMSNIKHWTDNYIMSMSFTEHNLAILGLKPETLKNSFINSLLYVGKINLLKGFGSRIARLIAFAYAAYPSRTLRKPLFYFLLISIPFSIFIGQLYRLYIKAKSN